MASWMVKVRALVSIAIMLALVLAFVSADEDGAEDEEGGLHILAAYALLGLALLHMLLNYKVGLYELKALLGLDKASRSRPKG
ncbi:MAG: hypothetical protein LUQ39_00790 [Methanomassiliicoccales archaeon]|nr:hypothetical protein [Methanomassiliicoccales archaeon]